MDIGYVPAMLSSLRSFLKRCRTDASDFACHDALATLDILSSLYEHTVNRHWWAAPKTHEYLVTVGAHAATVLHAYTLHEQEHALVQQAEQEHALVQHALADAVADIDRSIAAHPSELLWLMSKLGCARLYEALRAFGFFVDNTADFGNRANAQRFRQALAAASAAGLSAADGGILTKLHQRCRPFVDDPEIPLLREVYKRNDESNALILHALLCEFHRLCGLHPLSRANDAGIVNAHTQWIAEALWMPALPDKALASVVKVSGAPGTRAFLNDVYMATSEQHQGSPVYRKQSLYKGKIHWIINDRGDKSWYFGNTEIKRGEKGVDFAYALASRSKYRYPPDPTHVTEWQVNPPNAEDTRFVHSETMKCVKVEPEDFVWRVDACDVVLNTPTAASLAEMIHVWDTVLALHVHGLKDEGADYLSQAAVGRHASYQAARKIQSCLRNMQAVLQRTSADMGLCIMCEDRPVTQLFMPCKHAVCCAECATKWLRENPTCPQCRARVNHQLNVREYVAYHPDVFWSAASVGSRMVVLASLLRALR
jgi:hypothetical protein